MLFVLHCYSTPRHKKSSTLLQQLLLLPTTRMVQNQGDSNAARIEVANQRAHDLLKQTHTPIHSVFYRQQSNFRTFLLEQVKMNGNFVCFLFLLFLLDICERGLLVMCLLVRVRATKRALLWQTSEPTSSSSRKGATRRVSHLLHILLNSWC